MTAHAHMSLFGRYIGSPPLLTSRAQGPPISGMVEVRSTPFRRTVETARGVVTGLLGGRHLCDDARRPTLPLPLPAQIRLNAHDMDQEWLNRQNPSRPIPRSNLSKQQLAAVRTEEARCLWKDINRVLGWPDNAMDHDPSLGHLYDELHCSINHGLMSEDTHGPCLMPLFVKLEQYIARWYASARCPPQACKS
eukprot:COSAG05_NODE_1182_length_5594_cov_31.189081_5_plen_193_part_00